MASGTDRASQAKASAAANEKAGQAFTASSTPTGNTGRGFSSGRVTFDKSGNKLVDNKIEQFAGTSAYNQYLGERGVSNKGTVVNEGLFAKSDFSSVGGPNNAQQAISSAEAAKPQEKPSSYTENYGYTPDVKVSPIVSQNFAKNPLETDLSAPKPPRKSGSAESVFQSGGVQTPQSKELGNRYGWEALGAKTGTSFFTRGSSAEEQAKTKEASRASNIFTSNAKPLPQTDSAFGGPITPQSKGRSADTGNRLVRDSPFEQNVKASEAQKATQKYNAQTEEKSAFFTPTKPSSQAKQASVFEKQTTATFQDNVPKSGGSRTERFVNINEGLGFGYSITGEGKSGKLGSSGKPSMTPDELFATAEKVGAKEISVFDEQGNALGKVKANQQGLDFLKSSFKDQGYSISYGQGSSFIPSDVSNILSKGGTVIVYEPDKIFPAHSTPIGLAFGPSGQKEYAKLMSQAGPKGSYGFEYPSAQKDILSSVKSNPKYYESLPNSYWEDLGMKGYLNEQGIDKVNNIFHMYDKAQNAPIREQNKATANFISRINAQNDPAYNFNIRNEQGKVVKTTTGQRSYYDFLKSEGYGSKSKDVGPYVNNIIEPHFSNTPEAASKRYDIIPISPQQGVEAYGSDAKSPQPQLGGLQAISRTAESMGGSFVAGIESAFVHGGKQIPKDWWKSGSLNKPIQTTATDVVHTFLPISVTSLSKGKIEARNVELTPEASNLQNRTSAPNILGVLMGKEKASPNVSKEYYDVQAGFLIVGAIEGAKQINPIHINTNPLLFQKEGITPKGESNPIRPSYRGLTLGYGKYQTEIIGKNPEGKTIFGRPSIKQQAPSGYRFVAREQEGTEIANKGNAYSISKATNPDLLNYLSSTGRTIQPEAGNIIQTVADINKVSVASGHTKAERPFQAGITTDETVNKGTIKGIIQNQSFWSRFRRSRGGQGGEVYGSGLTAAGGSKGTVAIMKELNFEQKDVEQSIHPFLGYNTISKGEKTTSSVYDTILKEQGFNYNPETKSYEQPRGPENLPLEKQEAYAKQQLGEMKYDIIKSAGNHGLYTGGSAFLQLTVGKKGFRSVADVDLYFPISKSSFIDNLKIGKEAKIQTDIIKGHYKKSGKNPDDILINVIAKDPLGTGRKFIKIIDKNTGKSIVEIVPRAKPTKGIIKPDKVVTFAGLRGRKANQIMRDKMIIVRSLEEKQHRGKKLSSNQQKKLDKAKADIASFRNAETISTKEMIESGLLQDYLRTRKEGTKIYSYGKSISGKDVAEGGKIYEIPQLNPESIASAPSKGTDIFGYKIDKSTKFYPSIIGKKIKVATQVFNKQTQEKKRATINTKESLAQQGGVTQEHLRLIGEKAFIGEAVYSGFKAGARGSGMNLDDALRLLKNPATKEQGLQHLKNIDYVGRQQSWFYGVNWNKLKSVYFHAMKDELPQGIATGKNPVPDVIRESNQSYRTFIIKMKSGIKPDLDETMNIGNTGKNVQGKPSINQILKTFKPTRIGSDIEVSGGGPSSYPSPRNGLSGMTKIALSLSINKFSTPSNSSKTYSNNSIKKSNFSIFSGKSGISSTSKSEKSSLSGLSGRSAPSNLSTKSISGKSSLSIFSGLSGKSSLSGLSGKSELSSPSGLSRLSSLSSISSKSSSSSSSGSSLSGISGLSAISGISNYSGYSITKSPPVKNIPQLIFGNIGRKRKNRVKEGPTALLHLGTKNVFAPSFNIEISRNKRFEF